MIHIFSEHQPINPISTCSYLKDALKLGLELAALFNPSKETMISDLWDSSLFEILGA